MVEITGFAELQSKLLQLPDKVKKAEMLKLLGQIATSTVSAAKSFAPVSTKKHTISGPTRTKKVIQPGNLKRSIGKIVGKRGLGKENAVLYVGPKSKGIKNDGWYGHIVEYGHNIYKTGFKRNTKGNKEFNKTGAKGFVEGKNFMSRAYEQTKGGVTQESEAKVTRYIQKQIDRLSK